ncbi:hypothetical protein SLEP1_g25771 [Rubroshorea leprosula]|uniref:Uncharacterized protein n=1 Tax=Rubroshorea leprosula TaxID=152421 RepID=A0AAV5JTU4_9ROSI|nr:hypothetical protein SLEP1_g25771 [Rubroshorea leprosula]
MIATQVPWHLNFLFFAFSGKSKRTLVVEGRKITKEIIGFLFKILLKEGNIVAAVCIVLGCFALFRINAGE